MPTFAELLTAHIERVGISDADLARRIGISRLTLIRWKEGVTARPRHREDVLRCAEILRLTPEERDELLLSAEFQPESAPASEPMTEPQSAALVVAGAALGGPAPVTATGAATVLAPAGAQGRRRMRRHPAGSPDSRGVAVIAGVIAVLRLTGGPDYPVASPGSP